MAKRINLPTFPERFWDKVDKTGDCWNWTAGRSHKGYGVILLNGKGRQAHRVSYELANGPIPAGLQIDHTCHNRACVNPQHLRLATNKQQRENLSGPQRNNRSGVLGVCWAPRQRRWKAAVKHHGQAYHVGYFTTIEQAQDAVISKRAELFTHNDLDRRSA